MKRRPLQGLNIFFIFFWLGLGAVLLVSSYINPHLSVEKTGIVQPVMSSVSNVAKKVSPSIVGISNLSSSGDMFTRVNNEAAGSGVIYNRSGYIISNYHVVRGAESLIVTLADGNSREAALIGVDPRTDLAVLKIKADLKLTPARLGNSDNLQVGQEVVAIGNPLGLRFARSVTAGVVSGLNRIITTEEGFVFRLIQTDAAINPGNSGGALVNLKGEVVGINTIKIVMPGFEGMGFSIPSRQVQTVVNEIIKNGRVIRPVLGIRIVGEINAQEAKYYKLPVSHGVVVQPLPDSPAQKAGLKVNDIITKVNGESVETGLALQEKIFARKVGEKVDLQIIRLPARSGSKVQTIKMQVELVQDHV